MGVDCSGFVWDCIEGLYRFRFLFWVSGVSVGCCVEESF